ncbi:glycosyltransferase family 1 protein [Leptospira bourretii]|uniref:Glycosyltransferase family 1 protein n=2 Tax=Leptospira bourretii TaxID=2484962 RepID=A0A4V3JL29_9LEPT|nr:glycosyltransferase family 1 protein [Leptospira bourretii]TGK79450.1 glycosyltransferase family 1 protein [Leptospira bourretii]TGK89659.1 glycosyltransferase family 1 protein [Leptospira bourretii]
MKILFDHQIFFQNKYGGISKIFLEIMRRLKERKLEFDTAVSIEEYQAGILKDPISKIQINSPIFFSIFTIYQWVRFVFRIFRQPIPDFLLKRESGIFKRSLRNQIHNIDIKVNKSLEKNQYSIFHPTYFQSYYLPSLESSKTKMVLTVYDCVHEIFPEYYGNSNFILNNRKALCESASHIICISNTTKKDLLRIYKTIPEKKVSVIYLAGDLSGEPKTPLFFSIGDYVLFVGNRADYKNFKLFLEAFDHLRKSENIHLVCAGGGSFSFSEKKWIREKKLDQFVHQIPFSSEAMLANLYRNAKVFVYPSLYEGFGIPLLEAMSVGCPVLCSDTEVFHEVAGDAAWYFDPKNVLDLESKLLHLLDSENDQKELSERGYIQAEKFSWNKCADEHIRIYQTLSEEV